MWGSGEAFEVSTDRTPNVLYMKGDFGKDGDESRDYLSSRSGPAFATLRLPIYRHVHGGIDLLQRVTNVRHQHCGEGPLATSFSTSTQPKCRCASFPPTSVSPILPGVGL